MLLSLAIWVQNLEFFAYLRSSGYAFPAILAMHLSAISLFGAMIVATDLRLLGWAFRGSSIAAVVDQLRIPKRIGFLLAATCGFLLFCSKAEDYHSTSSFASRFRYSSWWRFMRWCFADLFIAKRQSSMDLPGLRCGPN
jgi:hypothetical protein